VAKEGNTIAIQSVTRMEVEVAAKKEREKEELMGKLKDLGNLFLKPFGLFLFLFFSSFVFFHSCQINT
jgi:hypothetical protein